MTHVEVRTAQPDDVAAIRQFGAENIPDHYRPLIGEEAARAQVDMWWTDERISSAIVRGGVAIAEGSGEVVGVGEIGEYDGRHVIWKLYVHPDLRGHGVGPQLIDKLVEQLPDGADEVFVEHFAANTRASSFYEREGFELVETRSHPENPAMDVVWRRRSPAGIER